MTDLKAWFGDVNLTKLTPEDDEAMQNDFSLTFKDDHSRRVLLAELTNLSFFRECLSESDTILCNHAKELLCRLGIWRPENAEKIVRKLLEIV